MVEKKTATKTDNVKKVAKKTEVKTETKKAVTDTKNNVKTPVKKAEVKKEKKEVKATSKYIQKVKKADIKKSDEAYETQQALKERKKHPTFRGRFGKKNIRKKSIAKWNKWRKPRSIDLDRGLQHGYRPKTGYKNPEEISGIHASGYREVRVENVADLAKINPKTEAARIGAAVGKKKRNDIITLANEKKIRVLN